MPLPCGTKFLQVLIFAIFSAIRKNKFPQTGITTKIYSRGNTVFSNLNWRTLSIVWKYVFLLHATKILSMLGTGYFLNRKSQKLIPSKRNQSFLIAKICSRKTQKNRQCAKTNSRKNFVPHGIRWKNDRSFDQPGPGRFLLFLTCVSSSLSDYLCNHQLYL